MLKSFFISICILGAASCSKLTATTQAVSLLTKSPDISTAAGFDAQLTSVLPNSPLLHDATTVFAVLGERQGPTDPNPPTPIGNATVTLKWSGNAVKICSADVTSGTYSATSIPTLSCGSASLSYASATVYKTEYETADDTYSVEVTAPSPIVAANVQFTPARPAAQNIGGVNFVTHPKSTALTVDWSHDPAAGDHNAFATLLRIRYTPQGGANPALNSASWALDPSPIFDNTPKDLNGLVALVTQAPATSVTIPSDRFAVTGLYILILTATELSTASSDNTVFGSGALAGAGTAFSFFVP